MNIENRGSLKDLINNMVKINNYFAEEEIMNLII